MKFFRKIPKISRLLRERGVNILGMVGTIIGILSILITEKSFIGKICWMTFILMITILILRYIYHNEYCLRSKDWKMFFKNDSYLHKKCIKQNHYPDVNSLAEDKDIYCLPLDKKTKEHKHIIQIGFVISGKMDTPDQQKGVLLIYREGTEHSNSKHKKKYPCFLFSISHKI